MSPLRFWAVNHAAKRKSMHPDPSEQELEKFSVEAHDLHVKYSISGLIVVGEEDFFVILEGSPVVVTRALTHIAKDDRHRNLIVLLAGNASERMYESWKVLQFDELACRQLPLTKHLEAANFRPKAMTEEELEGVIMALAKVA